MLPRPGFAADGEYGDGQRESAVILNQRMGWDAPGSPLSSPDAMFHCEGIVAHAGQATRARSSGLKFTAKLRNTLSSYRNMALVVSATTHCGWCIGNAYPSSVIIIRMLLAANRVRGATRRRGRLMEPRQ